MIKENISRLKEDISLICQRLGRNPGEITVVAVTKYGTVAMIEETLHAGISHIAENKVQEALKKFGSFKPPEIKLTRHMIGHLQTNKVKEALKVFDVIQSVDSLKLAASLDKAGEKLNRIIEGLVQVNTSGETQKYGIANDEAMKLIRQISQFDFIRVLGLMTIAPLADDREVIRDCFRKLRQLRDRVSNETAGYPHVQMKYLSMGMSSDYAVAIEEGSNMVRIGRAIFSHV